MLYQPQYSPSPYHASVRLFLSGGSGNQSLNLTPIPPDKLVDFSYMMMGGPGLSGGNEASFTLVDTEWEYLEGLLAPDRLGTTLFFDFGYTTSGAPFPSGIPLRSPWYQVTVHSVVPSFAIDHVRLSIRCLSPMISSLGGEGGQNKVTMNWGPGTECTWDVGETNRDYVTRQPKPIDYPADRKYKEGMTVAQIVQEIAWKHRMIPFIEDTKVIPATDLLESTDPVAKTENQVRSSDLAFIKHCLLDKAMKKTDLDATYTLSVTDMVPDVSLAQSAQVTGKGSPGWELHFHPIRNGEKENSTFSTESEGKYTYVFMRGQNSSVVELAIDISGLDAYIGGAAGCSASVTNMTTGGRSVHLLSNLTTPDKFVDDRAIQFRNGAETPSKYYQALYNGYLNSGHAYIAGRRRFIDMYNQVINATMTIQGHPPGNPNAPKATDGPQPGDTVLIYIPLKDGTPHYASGYYRIQTQTHVIQGGQYLQTMTLMRNAMGAALQQFMTDEAVGKPSNPGMENLQDTVSARLA